jgi:hypothetical protein
VNANRVFGQSDMARSEFELECVREFSHSGVHLGTGVSREERRERIRTAIIRENKQHARWRDTSMTYAAVYQKAYGRPLESGRSDEPEVAPLRAMRTLWDPDPFADDSELEDATEDDGL